MKKIFKVIFFYLLVTSIVLILIKIAGELEGNYNTSILADYSTSLATVEYVTSGNEAFSMSLKYNYFANGHSFNRTIEIDRKLRDYYRPFISNSNKTDSLKLFVIYSNTDNSKSLVNLEHPLLEPIEVDTIQDVSMFK